MKNDPVMNDPGLKDLEMKDLVRNGSQNRVIDRQLAAIDQENVLSFEQAKLISTLLSGNNSPKLKKKALITITNKAAFSANQVCVNSIQIHKNLCCI